MGQVLERLRARAKREVLTNPLARRVFRNQIRWSDGNKLITCLKANDVDLVVDVGANIGQTQDLLRLYGYTGDILSVEPVQGAHDILCTKAESDPHWFIAPRMAVGARSGSVRINVSRASDLSSLLPANSTLLETYPGSAPVEQDDVEMHTLDEVLEPYWPRYRSIFVKVDTQGSEEAVMEGGKQSLQRIRGIQMELSLVPLYDGEPKYLSVLDRLAKLDFEPHLLLETNFSFHLRRQVQFDVVAFRRKPGDR